MGDCVTSIVDQFWAQTRNGVTLGAIYAMIALGYTMVYGVLRLINFAHSEVFMISTVVTLFAVRNWMGITDPVSGIALVLVMIGALIPAMIAGGGIAVGLERVAYRPLRKRNAPRLSFLIAAIGASLALQYLFVLMDGQHYLLWLRLPNILGPSPQPVPNVMETQPLFSLFGAEISNKRLIVVVVAFVMMIALDVFVRRTRVGRGIRAVAQDQDTAAIMGVDIDRIIMITFLIGGPDGGRRGDAVRHDRTRGAGVLVHRVLPRHQGVHRRRARRDREHPRRDAGRAAPGLVEAYGTACTGAQWVNVIAFVVLVLVLMIRPDGILGEQVGG